MQFEAMLTSWAYDPPAMPSMFAYKVIGLIGLGSYALAYAVGRSPRVDYSRARLIAMPRSALPPMPRGYQWRMLSAPELAALAINIGPDVQAQRFAMGLRCLATFDRSGQLAGISWVSTDPVCEGDPPACYCPPPGCAWDTGLWIPPEKRMGRAYAAVWASIGCWLDDQGLHWSLSAIADYNIASLLAHERMGALVIGQLTMLRIGRLHLSLGARPAVAWISGPESLPKVQFSQLPPALAVRAAQPGGAIPTA